MIKLLGFNLYSYYFMQIVNVLYGDELYHAQVNINLVSSLCYVFLINAKPCSYVRNVLHAIISCFYCSYC